MINKHPEESIGLVPIYTQKLCFFTEFIQIHLNSETLSFSIRLLAIIASWLLDYYRNKKTNSQIEEKSIDLQLNELVEARKYHRNRFLIYIICQIILYYFNSKTLIFIVSRLTRSLLFKLEWNSYDIDRFVFKWIVGYFYAFCFTLSTSIFFTLWTFHFIKWTIKSTKHSELAKMKKD